MPSAPLPGCRSCGPPTFRSPRFPASSRPRRWRSGKRRPPSISRCWKPSRCAIRQWRLPCCRRQPATNLGCGMITGQRDDNAPGLPKLLVGPRRRLMALLIGTGLGMAVLSGASAFLMAHLLRGAASQSRAIAVAGLLIPAAGIGAGRVAERVLAERLGQHYVQELRTGLMAAVLADGRG